MNITNNTQSNPSFGNVIVEKGENGGRKIVEKLVRSDFGPRLAEIFKNNEKNFAADILVYSDKISVKNNITGEEFIPTGNVLSKVKNAKGNLIKELELAPNSAHQVEVGDSFDLRERNYLGTETEKTGFFNFSFVDKFFQRKSPESYIVEHEHNSINRPECYLYPRVGEFENIANQFNACLDIAKDIYANACVSLSEGCQNTMNAFINHLIK